MYKSGENGSRWEKNFEMWEIVLISTKIKTYLVIWLFESHSVDNKST